MDARQHCFFIQTGQGVDHYMSVDSRQELLRVEKAWYRANYLAVKYLGVKISFDLELKSSYMVELSHKTL